MKKIIAQKLKKIRNDLNYSTEYVSTELNKLGFSISPNTLYNYENGISQPKADMFLNLCKIYNVNSLDIFFNDINIEKKHNSYDDLNDIGKQKADEYIEDLKANQKYIQNESKSTKTTTTDFDTAIPVSMVNTKVKTNKD